MHEQSRKDRDNYVTIKWENIHESYWPQFEKCTSCDLQNSPYDYNSVMHYGKFASSKTGLNNPTIVTKNGQYIGQRCGFSVLDIQNINDLYCGRHKKIKNYTIKDLNQRYYVVIVSFTFIVYIIRLRKLCR